ncbi:hypothetical protein ACFRQM_09315 [Streptomyces sp. NPDC056831]|uniref:hypothetical protein n=1 Tax=Streptomyces sp. NPDC056831 TaxID=3345954 RepID=UPI00368421D6
MESEQLKSSSRRWANAALAALSEGPDRYDFAVHHAGVAAEHLLKAYLCGVHPTLIVDGKFDSLLHAVGRGARSKVRVTKVKTIGLMDAYARVYQLLPGKIPIDRNGFEPLADARNGVAHSSVYEPEQALSVFTICLRVIDPLISELEIDAADYWGPYRELHDKLVGDRVKAARVRLEALRVKARAVFQQRFGHLTDKEIVAVLATITNREPRADCEDYELKPCPVCAAEGWLGGGVTYEEYDGDLYRVLTPTRFDCYACDFEVDGEEFQELTDLTHQIYSEADPEDFWVPDDDVPGSMVGR